MLGYHFSPQLLRSNPVGIPEVVHNHDHKHENRIKDIQSPLMPKQISIVARSILDNTEARSYHNESTDHEQHTHALLPGDRQIVRLVRGVLLDTPLEDDCRDCEKAKNHNLDHQTSNDDTLAELWGLSRDHQASRTALHHEGEDVPGDKRPGQIAWLDERVVVGANSTDDATQAHVYGRREEGRAE